MFTGLVVPDTPHNQRLQRAVVKLVMRTVVNLRSHRRPSRRRVLVSPDPDLVAHMELPYPDQIALWDALAVQIIRWAADAPSVAGLHALASDAGAENAKRLGEHAG
jgi:hypothetical protein